MKFCRDCHHFNPKTDNCQHPDNSPVTDIVSGSRSYIPAEVCRHINVLCGTYALNWRPLDIPDITPGLPADWEGA
jgi:hypothetical protein